MGYELPDELVRLVHQYGLSKLTPAERTALDNEHERYIRHVHRQGLPDLTPVELAELDGEHAQLEERLANALGRFDRPPAKATTAAEADCPDE